MNSLLRSTARTTRKKEYQSEHWEAARTYLQGGALIVTALKKITRNCSRGGH
jgi:hypothetical protein